jgi:hypothetical protein
MNNGSPTVRLAFGGTHKVIKTGMGREHGFQELPALLVSYVYLDFFMKVRPELSFRDWVMDSGAFSAYNSGSEIKLQDYIKTCKQYLENDPQLTEVFALDVIGDWRASMKNCQKMWQADVPAIPCFHAGEPWEALLEMARRYPKIALGGVAYANSSSKLKWAEQCFARVWPKKIHGFGFGSERQILALPWHSVDATSWITGPMKFGRWQAYNGKMSVRRSDHNVRPEIEFYLDLEKKARAVWAKQMQELEDLDDQPKAKAAGKGK